MVDDVPEDPEQESNKQLTTELGRNENVNEPERVNASENSQLPPDGGCRAYVVVVASFCINGLIFGIMNSYSVIYLVLLKQLQTQKVDHAEVKACK